MTKIYQNNNILDKENIYRDDRILGGNYQRNYLLPKMLEQALIENEFYKKISNVLEEVKNKGRTLINKLINKK